MKLKVKGTKKNLFKELVEESIERSKLNGLRKNLIRQSNQLIEDALRGKYTLDKDELLKLSLPSFLKNAKQKEIKDIILISLYLVQMKKFLKLFGDDLTTVKDNGFYEQLKTIAGKIIYQKYNKNRLVIRYGEEGTNFFLLLKGEVQIILPNKKDANISLKEFKRYLLLLYIYREFELLRFVIKENKVSQRVGLFNANYFFFLEEYLMNKTTNNINKNNENNKNNNTNINKTKIKNININNTVIQKNNNIEEKSKYLINQIKEVHNKNLSILMKFYLKEEEILYYEKTKESVIKEEDDNIKLSPDDYINRLDYSNFNFYKEDDDDEDNKKENENEDNINIHYDERKKLLTTKTKNFLDITNDDEKSNFIIYEYKKIIELQTGDMFGDLALSANNAKRTATIITVDECHFACLTRKLYSEFIEKGNERVRNNKINYLCNLNLLKSFPRFILERKLFNHFAFKTFQKDKYILKTGEINNNIIFLKDGIFEVSFTGKLNDLNDLINFYYNQYMHMIKKKDNEETEEKLINNIKIMNLQKSKIERLFQKDINEEFSYILFLVNAPSIFGFRLTEKKKSQIVINKKENSTETINIYYSNFCVKCFSSKGEYIYIDKNMFYRHIYGMDGFVQDETKKCVIAFFRKTIKRLLNIRYIKIWNLFLANGVDKNLNININWDKLENKEDIYSAVDKLLSVLNEGQLYSNEMSKYINDYFEKKKQVIQTQKHKIKLINQNCESDKIKKMLILKTNRDINSFRNLELLKNNQIILNDINLSNLNNIYMDILNHLNHKNEGNLEEKYKKLVKKILNMTQENLNKKDIYIGKHKTRNKNRAISASSIFKNKSLFVSKTGKNITMYNYLLQMSREKSLPKENLSIISTAHSRKNGKVKDIKKINGIDRNNNEKSLKKEDKKSGVLETPYSKFILNKYKSFNFLSNRPSSTIKTSIRNHYFDSARRNKENYVNDRVKYIIKNTRILFTKTKNLDKIVRRKRSASTL